MGVLGLGRVYQEHPDISRDPCAYCGVGPPWHGERISFYDHIHARARGGSDSWWNMTAACYRCNMGKGDSSALHWLMVLG
jgi:5-methylcytosine-specific restriction endonuclease McrA